MSARLRTAAQAVLDAWESGDLAGAARQLQAELAEVTLASYDEIEEARQTYESDEVEIDQEAETSEADDGVWVQAWVWLDRSTEEDPE